MTINSFKEQLEEALNAHFPKKKSKERGAALVLFAQAMILHKKALEEKHTHNFVYSHSIYQSSPSTVSVNYSQEIAYVVCKECGEVITFKVQGKGVVSS